jgi:tetratricopeptide (TPR) repeat protein
VDDEKVTEALRAAVKAGDDGRIAELMANALADSDMRDDPQWEGAVLGDLAEAYANAGRFDDAIRTMRLSIELDPQEALVSELQIVEYVVRAGRDEDALAALDSLVNDYRTEEWLYWHAGRIWQDHGNHERALDWLSVGIDNYLAGRAAERLLLNDVVASRQTSLTALGLPIDEPQQRGQHLALALDGYPGE